jgi:hypothetical protein
MHIEKEIPWKRLIAEGAAIVVSILLAFWIDAWWDRNQASERERVLLEALLDDMQSLQADRGYRDQYAEALVETARKLLDIGRASETDATARDVDHLLSDLLYTAGGLDQGSHVLDMLFSGGELADISSRELRQILVDLRFGLVEEAESVRLEQSFMDLEFYPYLQFNGSFAQLWGADDGQPGNINHGKSSTDYPIGREGIQHIEVDHRDLLRERQFQNLLIRRIQKIQSVKGWEDDAYNVDGRLQDVITKIEQLLAY